MSASRFLGPLYCGAIACFLLAPVLVTLPLAFTSSMFLSYPIPSVSLRWFSELRDNDLWSHALWNSLVIACGSTVIAVVLGTAAAVGLREKSLRFREAIRTFFMLPLVIPHVVFGLALATLYLRIGLSSSTQGVMLAHAVGGVPFVIVNVSIALSKVPDSVELAAASLGASPLRVVRSVTLPLCAPGIISGAIFAFATSIDEVVVTLFVAGPHQTTIPLQMFSAVQDNSSPVVAAAAFVMIVPALLAVGASLFRYALAAPGRRS